MVRWLGNPYDNFAWIDEHLPSENLWFLSLSRVSSVLQVVLGQKD
jgi:hypothetical protein